jgi:hypothetical protein
MAGAAQAQAPAGPTGRYGAVMEYDPAVAPAQTVYRPRDLAQVGKIPIVAWGNGGCQADGGSGARPFLMQLASEGFLIIAPAKPGPDPQPQAPGAAPPPGPPPGGPPPTSTGPAPTTSADMIAGIDWAIRENSRPGSIYKGRLDTHAIAVMGHSCGGLQALEAAFDPRVTTAVIWSSGVLNTGGPLRGTTVTKADLKRLHTPVAYIQGGPTDVAYPNALDDYGRISGVTLFMGELNVGHGGTFRQPNGGAYSTVGTAWLNWRLKGDRTAAKMFTGADCGLCKDPAWKVSRKGMN